MKSKPLFAAVAALLAAETAMAQQVLTIADFHRSQRTYVGREVQITGLAFDIRQETRRRNGSDVPYTSLNLYEADAKGRKGKYYVRVSIPSDSFKTAPQDGQPTVITGPIQWPYQVGRIGD